MGSKLLASPPLSLIAKEVWGRGSLCRVGGNVPCSLILALASSYLALRPSQVIKAKCPCQGGGRPRGVTRAREAW